MLFLFLDRYQYNQPPLSLRGATCESMSLHRHLLDFGGCFIFDERRGLNSTGCAQEERMGCQNCPAFFIWERGWQQWERFASGIGDSGNELVAGVEGRSEVRGSRIVNPALLSGRKGGSKMRTCVICGGTRDNGNEKIIEDYCQRCLDTDVETLHRRYMGIEEKKEASRTPARESQEANG